MMSAEKTIRAQARAVLRGGWMKAIFAMIMVLLGAAFVDCISSVITLIYFELDLDMLWVDVLYYSVIVLVDFTAFFLISPIINGYIRMFYRGATNNLYHVEDLFYYFQNHHYGKALSINISFILRMLLPTLIAFIPVIAFNIFCSVSEVELQVTAFFNFILSILSSLIVLLWSFKYFLVYVYAVDFEYLSTSELFRSSKRMMKGKTGLVSKLFFSFWPWLLLSLTVLPILYTGPYITQAMCICAKWIARSESTFTQEG